MSQQSGVCLLFSVDLANKTAYCLLIWVFPLAICPISRLQSTVFRLGVGCREYLHFLRQEFEIFRIVG
jgi:hypothetical protein